MTHAQISDCRTRLAQHPRVDLGISPTLLENCAALGDHLGISLTVKRDDTIPLGLGGNKVRQLEFYLGQAVEQNADTVLITGAVQSNFVRLCVAAARKIGMKPVVQLEHRVARQDPAYLTSGNVFLNQLMGAEIHHFHVAEDESAADARLDTLAADLRAQGRRPFVIHLGLDYPPIGAMGYAAAALEVFTQCEEKDQWPDHIVVGSGSGLTHTGFLCGARAIGWDVPVHGICVRRDAGLQLQRITQRVDETCAMMGMMDIVSPEDIMVYDQVLAPGYGTLNAAVREAISLAAEKEGLILDPVYTGRVMAGLIALTRSDRFAEGSKVMMIHTGGIPGLFAYQAELMNPDHG